MTGFVWNVDEDFREVPESWIAAHRVQYENGHPVPDEHGHIPGGLESCDVTPVTSYTVLSENNGLDISVTKVGFRWIISTSSTAGTPLWSTMMLVSPLSWRHTERMKDCLKLSAFLWQTSWSKPLSLLEPTLMEIHMVNIYIQYILSLTKSLLTKASFIWLKMQ